MSEKVSTVLSEMELQPEEIRRLRTALVGYVEKVLKEETPAWTDGQVFCSAIDALNGLFDLRRRLEPIHQMVDETVTRYLSHRGGIVTVVNNLPGLIGEHGGEMIIPRSVFEKLKASSSSEETGGEERQGMGKKHIDVTVGISAESVGAFTSWCGEMREALDHLREVIERAPVMPVPEGGKGNE